MCLTVGRLSNFLQEPTQAKSIDDLITYSLILFSYIHSHISFHVLYSYFCLTLIHPNQYRNQPKSIHNQITYSVLALSFCQARLPWTLSANDKHVTRPAFIPKLSFCVFFVLPGNGTFSFSHILLVKVAVILDIARHNGSFPISPADIQFLLLKSESNLGPNEEIFWSKL